MELMFVKMYSWFQSCVSSKQSEKTYEIPNGKKGKERVITPAMNPSPTPSINRMFWLPRHFLLSISLNSTLRWCR
jgi:hypothetical protein